MAVSIKFTESDFSTWSNAQLNITYSRTNYFHAIANLPVSTVSKLPKDYTRLCYVKGHIYFIVAVGSNVLIRGTKIKPL